jgi:glutamate dehydrogenase/leucine dehydrogenase
VLEQLDSWMKESFGSVHMAAEREQVSLRDAAYVIAVDSVARACCDRGWV